MAAAGSHAGTSSQQVVTLLPLTVMMELDEIAKRYNTTRSGLIREACVAYIAKIKAGE